MIVAVDAGNTNVKATVYNNKDQILFHDAVFTIHQENEKYYDDFFESVCQRFDTIDGFIVSSVVPAITDLLMDILEKRTGKKGLLVNAELVRDLVIHLRDRNELGADLIASTYGALAKYKTPIIVADLGTATKITAINEAGEFMGGLILPGITISNKAIQLTIPHLPKIEPALPPKLLNDDTVASMQAGLMYGTLYQVTGIVDALEQELNIQANKVLTGGYGRFLYEKMPGFNYEETLLEDGILEIYKKYHK